MVGYRHCLFIEFDSVETLSNIEVVCIEDVEYRVCLYRGWGFIDFICLEVGKYRLWGFIEVGPLSVGRV